MIIQKIQQLILAFFLISSISLAVEIENISNAVNISGKQRMFTQKMLKNYAMIGMNNTFGNPKEDLVQIIKEFEDHQNALIKFVKDKKIKSKLDKMKPLWEKTKAMLSLAPEKIKVTIVQEKLNKLLIEADLLTKLLVKESKKSSGEIINISGKQRMLSQKMASLYMLKVWGFNDDNFRDKLNNSISLFKISKDKLKKSNLNTVQITRLLKNVDKSFLFFEMMSKSKSKFIPSLIYKKSNDILRDMNAVTSLYVKENNK